MLVIRAELASSIQVDMCGRLAVIARQNAARAQALAVQQLHNNVLDAQTSGCSSNGLQLLHLKTTTSAGIAAAAAAAAALIHQTRHSLVVASRHQLFRS
jgi:hypothetical protein